MIIRVDAYLTYFCINSTEFRSSLATIDRISLRSMVSRPPTGQLLKLHSKPKMAMHLLLMLPTELAEPISTEDFGTNLLECTILRLAWS